MDVHTKQRCLDTYPAGLLLALNKAKTVSWRLGVAWTLVSASGEILKCNGSIFNQHNESLISDVKSLNNAKKIYLTYCPHKHDLQSSELIEVLRFSQLVELNVYAQDCDKEAVSKLSERTAIPTTYWRFDTSNSTQSIGIAWVRKNRRPWVHIICSNSLGGGAYSLENMSERLGVAPYVILKGLESSLLYVQSDRSSKIGASLSLANPKSIRTCKDLIRRVRTMSTFHASVVTVVCDLSWLALLVRMSLANEVSYFLSLRSDTTDISKLPPIIDFPENDQWVINSSEIMGDFMQIILRKK